MSSSRSHKSDADFLSEQAQKKKHVETTDLISDDRTPPPNYTKNPLVPDSLAPTESSPEATAPLNQACKPRSGIFSPNNTPSSGASPTKGEQTATDTKEAKQNTAEREAMPGSFPDLSRSLDNSETQASKDGNKTQVETNQEDDKEEQTDRHEKAKKTWAFATNSRLDEYEDELEAKPKGGN